MILTRVFDSITNARVRDDLTPTVHYSSRAVDDLVASVRRAVARPARDATISYGADSIGEVASRPGTAIDAARLHGQIVDALVHPAASRTIQLAVRTVAPKVTEAQLAAQYPSIILVDRGAFRLRLFKNLKLAHTYTIAVGRVGLETPAGLYHIQDKQVNPSWHVPNSSWAGPLAGKVIPPGPQDPIKARWMGIYNGAGIHGTDELSSLGSAASHGCIRMAIPDVIALFPQVSIGTPVYIA
jgi:lipoprotein-anchoring transpeptidase ErfK/SrfK